MALRALHIFVKPTLVTDMLANCLLLKAGVNFEAGNSDQTSGSERHEALLNLLQKS
jgi:hypothetical protein